MNDGYSILSWGRAPRAAAFAAALVVLAGTTRATSAQQATDPPPVPIGRIEIVGNSRLNEASILGTLTIREGDTLRDQTLRQSLGRLWATQQFDDIRVYGVPDPADPLAPITLRVEVAERPVLAALEFRGLENIKSSTVRDTVGIATNRPLNIAKLTETEAMIRSLLADKGYFARRVSHTIEDIADRPGEKRVIFDVEEGERVAIADVEFEGNEVFDNSRLRDVVGTKAEGFFWFRTGTFDEDQFRTDLREALPQHYARNGYLDFAVIGDTLVVDPETGKARLIVTVAEGEQYILATFDIQGNRQFPTDQLRRYFELERGGLLGSLGIGGGGQRQVEGRSVFDAVAFQRATEEVASLYRNQGYIKAVVSPVTDRIPATDSTPPMVRAAWQITEGAPAFIDEIKIAGNTYTHEDVIRGQLLVLPGDVYSEELLIQSYQRISALGFFETPLPLPNIDEDENGDIDVTFEVKEKQTGSVNFGTALGGVTGVAGFLGYDQPNLFGQAKSGHLRWEFGRFSNNFEASYSDPSILGSVYSGSLSLFSSRDRFFTFSEGRRRRTGVGLRFGFPFFAEPRRTRVSVGYSISRTTYEEFDSETTSSLFSLPPGVQSTASIGLTRSTTDHPIFPTVGSRAELLAELNGGLLGGDGDFQKYTISSEWYVPVGSLGGNTPGSRPIRLTLGLAVEGGAIFGDASRFPFDRFWLGGVQFGRPLRGYDETTITPNGYIDRNARGVPLDERFGNAYLRMSATYAVRFNDNISLGLFYDAGNVWRDPGEINPMKLARGAGVGLTLVTPFGPLGLDYAYGFDKRPPGWQLHFKFGQGF
ncbi:MAG: outer membrane protein assembly factor BamA [Gemmatimonadetes bacterium]|nr:outer membrane protein assembly factor BamA [Gemmatimonadota bacterium]